MDRVDTVDTVFQKLLLIDFFMGYFPEKHHNYVYPVHSVSKKKKESVKHMATEKRNEYQQWRAWMIAQVGRDDYIGDFAEDVKYDSPDERPVIIRGENGKHFVKMAPITTIFGYLRWLKGYRTDNRRILRIALEAYHEWRKAKRPALSPRLRFLVLKRDNYRCQLCGRSAHDGVTLEVDHIHPRAQGGSNELSNLQTLCWDCNRGKRDSSL